ncbi:hypothetical protein V5O48_005197 [Marasmius crinis-equi]|uniref:HTH APSES-type domain-containing protein n=1 Tax=Marasmius crinis-equi TaxID=585013 RepID=A0ABR3FNS0_9AGAR
MRHADSSPDSGSVSPSPIIPTPTPSFTFISEESMASGSLQDAASPPSSNTSGPKFRPYASSNHHVTKGRYITSNDPRGYIPVYEYPLNGQWIMMDIDDGYILWTGIWKALGNSKADIVKMIDSQPDLAAQIRRVRGGYLKIQGTWMPYEVALRLSRRVAWPIREDLVPLFGPTFPSTCLAPDQPGYGQVVASAPGRRRARRTTTQPNGGAAIAISAQSAQAQQGWTVMTSQSPQEAGPGPHQLHPHYSAPYTHFSEHAHSQSSPSVELPGSSTSRERGASRYTPYPSMSNHSPPLSVAKPSSSHPRSIADVPVSPLSPHPHSHPEIVLPPIERDPSSISSVGGSSYALPPISALEDLRGIDAHDSAAVLRRLKSPDQPGEHPQRLGTPAMPSRHSAHSPGYSSSSWPPPLYHSASVPSPSIHRLPSDPSMRSTHHTLRSYESRDSVRSKLSVSFHSDSSCAPSPVSPPSPSTPATPHSVISSITRESFTKDSRQEYHYPSHHPSSYTPHLQNPSDYRRGSYSSESFSRRSSESEMQLDTSRQPHRPW